MSKSPTTMPVATQVTAISPEVLEKLIIHGDLSGMSPTYKVQYYNKVCESVGLNPLTQPFKYLKLQGKEILYADKSCGEQLRMLHKISIEVTQREKIDDMYVVTVTASKPDGRKDGATGVVPIGTLKGDWLANAMMKAETKAKRRVTLSICGLNMLDESEVEDIPSGIHPEQPPDEMLINSNANDPFEEPRFTRGTFARYKPSEKDIATLRKWVETVEKRLSDPNPKKPLTPEERKEWEWNVEIAANRIAEVENQDPASFEAFKG